MNVDNMMPSNDYLCSYIKSSAFMKVFIFIVCCTFYDTFASITFVVLEKEAALIFI